MWKVCALLCLAVVSMAHGGDRKGEDLKVLTDGNFQMKVDAVGGTKGDWFVEFYAPWCGHCKRLAPTWKNVAIELLGHVNVGMIDATENRIQSQRFGVDSFPTLIYIKKGKYERYKGKRDTDSLVEWATTCKKDGLTGEEVNDVPPAPEIPRAQVQEAELDMNDVVVVLDDDNFEHETQASTGATTGDWFVEFYAPWCGHCKALAPTWQKLAAALEEEGKVNVGKVDAIKNPDLKKRFGIGSFPTIIYFSKGKMAVYKGSRYLDSLTDYAKQTAEKGFSEDEKVVDVPAAPSQLAKAIKAAQEHLSALKVDLGKIWDKRKNALFVIVGSSLVAGFVLGRLTGGSSKSKQD